VIVAGVRRRQSSFNKLHEVIKRGSEGHATYFGNNQQLVEAEPVLCGILKGIGGRRPNASRLMVCDMAQPFLSSLAHFCGADRPKLRHIQQPVYVNQPTRDSTDILRVCTPVE
jgi:hypothetical protein